MSEKKTNPDGPVEAASPPLSVVTLRRDLRPTRRRLRFVEPLRRTPFVSLNPGTGSLPTRLRWNPYALQAAVLRDEISGGTPEGYAAESVGAWCMVMGSCRESTKQLDEA